jgi:signal transduction histidine kinase
MNATGIGLWAAKSIVDKVGGNIEVVSSTTGKTWGVLQYLSSGDKRGTRRQAGDGGAEDNWKHKQA